jgi:lycopene beta-cyclase
MTYALYLAIFLGGPLMVLGALAVHDRGLLRHRLPWIALGLHAIAAVVYTTPWDNYLVATAVWWYDPQRVLGLTFGYVPMEEYSFFVLQTAMTGLWLLWLRPRSRSPLRGEGWGEGQSLLPWRWRPYRPGLLVTLAVAVLWVASLAALWTAATAASYLALTLAWFLPPIILQLIVGADILWNRRRLALCALLPPIAYLSVTDAVAIHVGIWTISPQHTLGILAGGVLPIEEIIFFTLTNILIVFGMLLMTTLWPVLRPNGPPSAPL